MPHHADLGATLIWYDRRGSGDPLVLLHGGFQDATTFDPIAPELAEHFTLFLPEQRGHGHTPDVAGPITFEAMAADTIAFLERIVGGAAHLVGHSDGGIIALLVALRRPDLVRKLVPISAPFHHNGVIGMDFTVAQVQTFFGDRYAATSPDGGQHFPVVAAKLLELWRTEPTMAASDLSPIAAPTLVMAADDDSLTWEHVLALYQAIPGAELAIVPGTSHGLIAEKPDLVNRLIIDFLTHDPVATHLPGRRASQRAPDAS